MVSLVTSKHTNWQLTKDEFLSEMKNRSYNVDILSKDYLQHLFRFSLRIAKLWDSPSGRHHRYRKELVKCIALDIACILHDDFFSYGLANPSSKNEGSNYPDMLIGLVCKNDHMMTSAERKYLGEVVYACKLALGFEDPILDAA